MEQYQSIHFIGIGGIGVSALARLCLKMGKKVSGSDMRESAVTAGLEELGVEIFIGHVRENVVNGVDLVVHTEDVNESSAGFVELSEAQSRSIKTLKYSQALGLMMRGKKGLAVSGTNGKSTTSAILGLIMEASGVDPMVVIGSNLSPKNESENFKGNARFGQGEYFVYEADEYHRHMLDTKPHAVIVTNIEADHLDYYKDLDDIKGAFKEFILSVPANGLVVFNADDPNTVEVCAHTGGAKKITFTMRGESCGYYCLKDVSVDNQQQEFTLLARGKDMGRFVLKQPGQYNLMNALAALAMALELGVAVDIARDALANFAGIWRRFETVGTVQGKPVISDYAHHPTAVSGLIEAAKSFYPDKKILLVYQPHQKHRTRIMFNEFVEALGAADAIILPEIYFVPGREQTPNDPISSKDLVEALRQKHVESEFAPTINAAEELIRRQLDSIDVIICAGAGTIDQLARKLVD
jgi:UDP-N-acetylmuramate--alanine ligase